MVGASLGSRPPTAFVVLLQASLAFHNKLSRATDELAVSGIEQDSMMFTLRNLCPEPACKQGPILARVFSQLLHAHDESAMLHTGSAMFLSPNHS